MSYTVENVSLGRVGLGTMAQLHTGAVMPRSYFLDKEIDGYGDPKRRARTRKKKYGITQDEYDALLERQGRVCGICGEMPVGYHGGFHVDHDHATGRVRGLLCGPCNLLLGHARDDTRRLLRAVDYLANANEDSQETQCPAKDTP